MGLLGGIGSTFSAIGSVAGGVFNIVKSAGKLAGKIADSLVGKIAIGAGVVSILTSNPNVEGGSIFDKMSNGFKAFLGNMSNAASTAALGVTATAMSAGQVANGIIADVTSGDKTGTTLQDSVAEDAGEHGYDPDGRSGDTEHASDQRDMDTDLDYDPGERHGPEAGMA